MMPSWRLEVVGVDLADTTSGTPGSMRHADELSITVAPRAAAWGARSREMSAAGAEQRDVDAVERVAVGLPDLDRSGRSTCDGPAGRPPRGEQPQLPDREAALAEHLDHRPTDDAGGADDGNGEGVRLGHPATAPGMAPQGIEITRARPGV